MQRMKFIQTLMTDVNDEMKEETEGETDTKTTLTESEQYAPA